MKHTAIDWGRLFQNLYGHSAEVEEPAHFKAFQALSRDLVSALLARSKEVIRQVTFEADKQGLLPHLQYVFFILMERPQNWPSLNKAQTSALHLIRSILSESGDTPNYTDGLRIPPDNSEPMVDSTLKALALWATTALAVGIRRDYKLTVQKHLTRITASVPPPAGVTPAFHVTNLFEVAVENHPMAFPGGHLLNFALSTIF